MFLFQGTWGAAKIANVNTEIQKTKEINQQKFKAETIISDGVARGKTNSQIMQDLTNNGFKVEVKDNAKNVVYPPGFILKSVEEFNKNKELSVNIIQNEMNITTIKINKEENTVNNKPAGEKEATEKNLTQCLAIVNDYFTGRLSGLESLSSDEKLIVREFMEKQEKTYVEQKLTELKNQNPQAYADYVSGKKTAHNIIDEMGWQKDFKSWIQEQLDAIKEIKGAGAMTADERATASIQTERTNWQKEKDDHLLAERVNKLIPDNRPPSGN